MPEGHTIHRLARNLLRDLKGCTVVASSPQGRFTEGAAVLDGARILRTDALGKHLFVDAEPVEGPPVTLHVHLGLFGRFRRHRTPGPEPKGALRLRLAGPEWTWDLSGPTACSLMGDDEIAGLTARLGPDPLRSDSDAGRFVTRAGRSRTAIGALLMDQSVVAGVGNVYRSELCFRLGIDPRVPGRDLDEAQLRVLWADAAALLRVGVRLGRIVTVDPNELDPDGPPRTPAGLRRDERLYVYRRHQCLRCGGPVEWFDLANRRAYACGVDQAR